MRLVHTLPQPAPQGSDEYAAVERRTATLLQLNRRYATFRASSSAESVTCPLTTSACTA